MTDKPERITIFVYQDFMPFMTDKGKVWRVTDHTPPDDITDRERTEYIRIDKYEEVNERVGYFINHLQERDQSVMDLSSQINDLRQENFALRGKVANLILNQALTDQL